jgi:hypothetical protein
MGIKPNSDVDKLAAKILAVRQSGGAGAEEIIGNKALSDAVRQRWKNKRRKRKHVVTRRGPRA